MQLTTPDPATPSSPLIGLDRTTVATRLEEDADGRLFDPAVRRVGVSQGMGVAELTRAEAFAALSVVTKILHAAVERRLGPLGLTLQHSRALWIVRAWGGDGPQLRALAEQLHLTPRAVTAIVDGLEAEGLLERIPDPSDRRAVTARLTEAGRARCDEAKLINTGAVDELLGDIDGAELAQLRHLCYRLVLRARDEQPHTVTPVTATTEDRS
jgi:DNA-binding MarR family transcriptional regulator